MSKKCAKCSKTVYPTEELKCLDKIWHKACFKCETCNMTLTMKNYKGYDKMPYCNTHYPKTKFTAVADTPESRRIAENTKIQSSVQYHAEFEKMKGTKTSVISDPETERIRKNTMNQSNVAYHGQLEKKMWMEDHRPAEQVEGMRVTSRPGKISEYDPMKDANSPYSDRTQTNVVFDSTRGEVQNGTRRQPGSIADYDPMAQNSPPSMGYNNPPQHRQPQPYNPTQPQPYVPPQQARSQPPPAQPQASRPVDPFYGKGLVCQAIYDYSAADTDEVSFKERDIIIHCEVIDAGWMTGVVERTGKHGMLPSNYVEKLNG